MFDATRDEIKASMRAQVDRAIEPLQTPIEHAPTELRVSTNDPCDEPLTDPDTDAPTDPHAQTVPN